MTKPDYIKDFLACIEHFRYRFDVRDVFRDWTEIMAATLHQRPYHEFGWQTDPVFDRIEADYLAAAKRYEAKDFEMFAAMIHIAGAALAEAKQDFLGQCYMRLEIARKGLGQEFTPYEISYMLARVNLDGMNEVIERMGFFTIHEPACGAGSMIIAAAQVVEEAQRDPSATMWFDAVDIDRLCANMAYIQCSLLGLSGIVWHGDTLRMEMKSYRLTPAATVNYERSRRMFDYTRGKWELEAPLPATGLVQMPMVLVV